MSEEYQSPEHPQQRTAPQSPSPALRVILVLLAAPLVSFAYYIAIYFYASHLGGSIPAQRPLSREQLESYLHFYIAREIAPKDSMWGWRYQLGAGEHMRQYLIGGVHPLDIVYDRHNHVLAVYESYE